jgi:hypothetical protein
LRPLPPSSCCAAAPHAPETGLTLGLLLLVLLLLLLLVLGLLLVVVVLVHLLVAVVAGSAKSGGASEATGGDTGDLGLGPATLLLLALLEGLLLLVDGKVGEVLLDLVVVRHGGVGWWWCGGWVRVECGRGRLDARCGRVKKRRE